MSSPVPAEVPLGLYVHLPWCVSKCPYCDFNSHALRGRLPATEYVDALLADLDTEAPLADGRVVETVFIGGGTPSLFPGPEIARLIDGIRTRIELAGDAEVTLEANPGAVDAAGFAACAQAGVNRLSIGAQSFDPGHLRTLGRIHGPDDVARAVEAARAAGIPNFNLDLMYGLPDQDVGGVLADLEAALALEPRHLSHYQLTLEPNTRFHARPPEGLPDEETGWRLQRAAEERLAAAGFARYEVSAWARPGSHCRHNVNYWRFGDYLAIGAGAHGKLTLPGGVVRYVKPAHPRAFMERAGRPAKRRPVPPEDLEFEFLLNALRLADGFELAEYGARTGRSAGALSARLSPFVAGGLLLETDGRIRPSRRGYDLLDGILSELLPAA